MQIFFLAAVLFVISPSAHNKFFTEKTEHGLPPKGPPATTAILLVPVTEHATTNDERMESFGLFQANAGSFRVQ